MHPVFTIKEIPQSPVIGADRQPVRDENDQVRMNPPFLQATMVVSRVAKKVRLDQALDAQDYAALKALLAKVAAAAATEMDQDIDAAHQRRKAELAGLRSG